MSTDTEIAQIGERFGIVGRRKELGQALVAVKSGKHLMIEGPVGVGKTVLALAVARHLGRPVFRVDGDERYTEQKLAGWFDPPVVLQKGYIESAFIPGPLTLAMRAGGILFVNEMNRMPEGVQNVLLPSMDEGLIEVPKVGTVKAKEGFVVIATQNPREFVATTALSEALSDRFELVLLDYQPEEDEREIVRRQTGKAAPELVHRAVWVTRRTRDHPNVRRGASVRAAMSIVQLASVMSGDLGSSLRRASHMALPTRIELREESKLTAEQVIDEIVNECLAIPPPSADGAVPGERSDREQKKRARSDEKRKALDASDLVGLLEQATFEQVSADDDLSWKIALNYSAMRARTTNPVLLEVAKRIAIKAVIRRVLQLLGPVTVPTRTEREPYAVGTDGELDVEETIERAAERGYLDVDDIVLGKKEPKKIAVALMLDASLSMSGDKLAIATAAVAVLAYRLKSVDYLVITFNDVPRVVKRVDAKRYLDELVSELLDFNATGYTNIEGALVKGREELGRADTRNQVGILVTDGNYTVGGDPSGAAAGFKRLYVIMTESHDCRPEVCEGIAASGGGRLYEVSSFEEIPRVLYKVLRMVAQGSPHSRSS